jgi:hypothetical protein
VDFQQFSANRVSQFRDVTRGLEFQLLKKDLPHQRITICVQTGRCNTDDGVAGPHGFPAIQHPGFFHHADDGAAHVVFALVIKAGHWGCLAADERAMIFRAGAGETFDDFGENVRLQFSRAEVIEEKQRLGAQPGDAIDAMVIYLLFCFDFT